LASNHPAFIEAALFVVPVGFAPFSHRRIIDIGLTNEGLVELEQLKNRSDIPADLAIALDDFLSDRQIRTELETFKRQRRAELKAEGSIE